MSNEKLVDINSVFDRFAVSFFCRSWDMSSWWRHQMEKFSTLLAIYAGNSPVTARINGWVNNGEAGDLRRYRAYYDVILRVIC